MIAEKLRKSIFQSAIQGKLTAQLPEDGDARDLLEAIKAEKARLTKEGKIKKETQLPEITEDEIPFDIPENWCWVRLGHAISVSSGKGLTQNNMDTKGVYPVYGGNGINGTHSDWFVSEATLVIGRVGFYCGCVHKVVSNCWVTDNALIVQMKKNIYNIDFLQLILRELDLKNTSVSTAQPVISGMRIYPQVIPVPPISEQLRILEKLNEILSQIDKLEKDELKLDFIQKSFPKKMKDSLLQAAIQGKLTEQLESDGDARALVADIQKEKERLIKEGKIKKERVLPEITEDEIPFDIPDSWCWVRLGEVTDYGTGKQVNQNNIAPNSWILELEDIEKETYKLSSKRFDRKPGSSKNAFTAGDILYGKLRPYLKKVIIADESGYCSTEIIPFRGYGNINSSYLKYCMVAPTIDSYINQITHGMDMPRLGTDKAKQLVIPLPPLDEQQRIVARLELLLPLCDALE